MKFATKAIRLYQPHLRHVDTLPWKVKNSNFGRYSADMEEKGQDFDKMLVFEGLHSKDVDRRISYGQSCGSAVVFLIVNRLNVSFSAGTCLLYTSPSPRD